MPRLFSYSDFSDKSAIVKTYADKHTPVVVCNDTAVRGKSFRVKVRIGIEAKHPNIPTHHFEYIQLWNLETLVGEIRLCQNNYGKEPLQIEVDFCLKPTLSMRLTALAYCNKHGLWRSEEQFVKIKDE